MDLSSFLLAVRTDREPDWEEMEVTSRNQTDTDLEFTNVSYRDDDIKITVAKGRKKKWQWQQFRIASAGYEKPFGLLDIYYRYESGGRIKT